MKKNNQTMIMLLGSAALIIVSTLIEPDDSSIMGIVQTVILGVGLLGCCVGLWKFGKGIWRKN